MSELITSNLIKIILGLLVVVAVIIGIYFIFKDKIFIFFGGTSPGEPLNLIRSLI